MPNIDDVLKARNLTHVGYVKDGVVLDLDRRPVQPSTIGERATAYMHSKMDLHAADRDQRQNQILRHLVQFATAEVARADNEQREAILDLEVLWTYLDGHKDAAVRQWAPDLRAAIKELRAATKAPRVKPVAGRAGKRGRR